MDSVRSCGRCKSAGGQGLGLPGFKMSSVLHLRSGPPTSPRSKNQWASESKRVQLEALVARPDSAAPCMVDLPCRACTSRNVSLGMRSHGCVLGYRVRVGCYRVRVGCLQRETERQPLALALPHQTQHLVGPKEKERIERQCIGASIGRNEQR